MRPRFADVASTEEHGEKTSLREFFPSFARIKLVYKSWSRRCFGRPLTEESRFVYNRLDTRFNFQAVGKMSPARNCLLILRFSKVGGNSEITWLKIALLSWLRLLPRYFHFRQWFTRISISSQFSLCATFLSFKFPAHSDSSARTILFVILTSEIRLLQIAFVSVSTYEISLIIGNSSQLSFKR